MLFIRLGNILAYGAIILGSLRVAIAVVAIFAEDTQAVVSAYLGSGTTGHYIDQGVYSIVFGVVVGLLVRICKKYFTQ